MLGLLPSGTARAEPALPGVRWALAGVALCQTRLLLQHINASSHSVCSAVHSSGDPSGLAPHDSPAARHVSAGDTAYPERSWGSYPTGGRSCLSGGEGFAGAGVRSAAVLVCPLW